MTTSLLGAASGNVWALFYRANRCFSDVTVAESHKDDPAEWDRARAGALENARICAAETVRWLAIVDELERQQQAA